MGTSSKGPSNETIIPNKAMIEGLRRSFDAKSCALEAFNAMTKLFETAGVVVDYTFVSNKPDQGIKAAEAKQHLNDLVAALGVFSAGIHINPSER